MRRYLGGLAGVAALCVMSWAQTPAPTPAPQQPAPTQAPPTEAVPIPTTVSTNAIAAAVPFPRLEFFAGGTYAEAGLFNAGHWAGLYGWDSSLSMNATHWLGFVVEGGEYFGTSKIPTATPAPFPSCGVFCPGSTPTFDVTTREYTFLFGAQFSRRNKWERWTPFGEVLYGHQGTRGQATALGTQFTEVGTGLALVAGGGFDRKITPRYALRFKADYFLTGTAFPQQPKQKQDNFRFSVGVVIRSVHKKKRTLEDEPGAVQ